MAKKLLHSPRPVTSHTDYVGPGSTFVAIKGMAEDGVDYILHALGRGAKTIVVETDVTLSDSVQQLIEFHGAEIQHVENTRKALAELSLQAWQFPNKKLSCIAVTGTKGKTTTAYILHQILIAAGYNAALLSSTENKLGSQTCKSVLTTEHPDYLHAFFAQCVQEGVTHVVMEVAAQATTLYRTHGLEFDYGIFTNFSLEHSEFYTTQDDYFAAKIAVLSQVKNPKNIFVNVDDDSAAKIKKLFPKSRTYGIESKNADIHAVADCDIKTGVSLTVGGEQYNCPELIGLFNAYNMLAAYAVASAMGVKPAKIAKGFEVLQPIPGRMNKYNLPNRATCFIDKAHNPSSYEAVLSTLRPLTDHLIIVFGAGGERDKKKRPIMGALAAHFCDVIVITSDDPRSEDQEAIIDDILVGIPRGKKVACEVYRKRAIKYAYNQSRPNSIIVILGKGSEEYQLIQGIKHYFSEKEILKSFR